ncbi:MAG: zinc-binding dehydrogenase [Acidimicrobiales bacterium]|nr:zinc-binding dehydrogenase [Acidimicrobiales bacterium]
MTIPTRITGLLVKQHGYNTTNPEGHIRFESMDPYIELGEVDTPDLASGQVLVEMSMAPINPSDLHFLKGEYGQPRVQGKPAGFEGVGTVIAAGDDAYAQSLVGTRVSFAATPTGTGTWATHAVSDAELCIPMPETVSDHDAAGFIVNPLTAAAMFEDAKSAGSPGVVLTAGASQVSKFIVALARDAGLESVCIVRRDVHNDALTDLGATAILNQNDDDFDQRLKEVMKTHKPRFLIDAVVDATSTKIFNAMGSNSTWLVYGSLSAEIPPLSNPGEFIFMNKVIRGFWLAPWLSRAPMEEKIEVFGEVQARFADGRWSTDVAATLRLAHAPTELVEALADPRGKVFITP